MPSNAEVNQLIRLLKKLWPKALRWWKKRQQQQNQQGGSYASHAGQQQGSYGPQGGSYGAGGSYGPNQSYGQQSSGGPPQHQSSYGGPPQQQASYGGMSQAPVHQQSFQHGDTSHFGQHAPHVNQDMVNASNQQYVSLRNQAIHEGDLMHQAFDKASKAHDRGDGAAAKQFSNEGHEHQRRKDELNQQASDWIYNTNNQQSPNGTVDLHGLYVQEAIRRTEQAVQDGQRQGLPELRVITGKGLHSQQHVAKIKPAIEDLMRKYNLSAHIDPHNTGVLIVNLQGGGSYGSRDLSFADQLASQAEGDKCIIS